MKGLVYKLVAVSMALVGGLWGKEVQLKHPFLVCSQGDRDLGLVQKFFLFSVDQEVNDPDCSYFYDLDGHAIMQGPEERMDAYLVAFGGALKKMMGEGIPEHRFEELKEVFVLSLASEIGEQELAKEIRWEMTEFAKESLMPRRSSPQVFLVSHGPELFYQLHLSADDQSNISKMVKNLGELGWLGLLKKKSTMEKLGDKILPVHPLRFLGYVVSNPSLKRQLPKIVDDFVKRKSFFNGHGKRAGFSQRMSSLMNQNQMMQYLPGFAQQVGASEHAILPYFQSHDWEGLVRYLM